MMTYCTLVLIRLCPRLAHWVPLAVVGRTQRNHWRRSPRLSGRAGVAHALVSVILGRVVIAIGPQFRSSAVPALLAKWP